MTKEKIDQLEQWCKRRCEEKYNSQAVKIVIETAIDRDLKEILKALQDDKDCELYDAQVRFGISQCIRKIQWHLDKNNK